MRDAYSRKVLAVALVARPGGARRGPRAPLSAARPAHGDPERQRHALRSTRARGGLTVRSACLVSLGIRVVRSRPGRPQDNGAHERMHRDLSELQLAPASTRRAQQRPSDRWIVDFNHVRPHDALGARLRRRSTGTRSAIRPAQDTELPTGLAEPSCVTRWVHTCQRRHRLRQHRAGPSNYRPEAGDRVALEGTLLRHRPGDPEILPINDAFCSDTVIRTVNAIHAKQGLRDLASVSA